ncbi:class I SAM-dependent methyltransferase [Haloarcula sp. CBA1130]|uniref:class I SAM-dependent methyltransferase n=1 Tax=unclassified Haloarcula TaxID=2624677 RepID=UPI0012484567|nr:MULTISPECIES: class I SAM-dependent methyltransferase [unclassified Haloarcula]KAA9399333.1 class I SAM-dependent methyltransferase [Haloarcula sp. CBA1129]KAA9403847.1 class I SAM-dependent methyltransferase [Haloarcula sp. CBA1130]
MPDDAFGRMVRDFHRDDLTARPQYRRDDDDVTEAHLAGYFEPLSEWHPIERRLLPAVTGRVLDTGCGVGRHALTLQERGHDVLAVDRSPGAVAVARKRGVAHPVVGDLRRPPGDGFDTVTVLGKQLGLGSSLADLRTTLTELAAVTQPGGRLVADMDTLDRADPETDAAHRTRPGVAYRTFRVEYDGLAGPWTDLLLVTPSQFRAAVSETPWTVDVLVGTEKDGSAYGVRLSLPA